MRVPTTFFADLVCPYCYVALAPLERLRDEGRIELRLRPFEVHPRLPREGVALSSFGRAAVDGAFREIGWIASEVGRAIVKPERVPNSRRALEAVEMARSVKGDDGALELARRAFAAYFAEGKDIGYEAVLRAIASAVGIPRALQDACFLAGRFSAAVDAARADGHDRMVSAVPATFLGDHPVAGYRPYGELRALVERLGGRS